MPRSFRNPMQALVFFAAVLFRFLPCPAAAQDPMAWQSPAQMPAIKPILDPGDFQNRFQAALKQIDTTTLTDVGPVQLPPGQPIDIDQAWYPAQAYWNGKDRDARWDSAMLVACVHCDDDPALAQSALAQAQQAGFHGWLLPALAARIAWRDWRFQDTLNFGTFALKVAPPDRVPIIARWMYGAAKADFKLQLAQGLSRQYPVAVQDDRPALRRALRLARSFSPRQRLLPSDAVEQLTAVDHSGELATIHVDGSVDSPGQISKFSDSGTLTLRAPPGQYQLFAFGPTASNVELTAHFHFKPTAGKSDDWEPSLNFGIVDPAIPKLAQIKISLFPQGLVDFDGPGPGVGISETPAPAWDQDGTIRILVIGPDVQVFIDGKMGFFGPIRAPADTRKLGFMVQGVGVHASVSNVSWKEYKAKGA